MLGEREDFEPLRTTLAVARARLHDRLRRDCAIVYDVGQRHRVVGPGRIHAFLDVDHRYEDSARVRDAVLATLTELAENGPTAEELDVEVDQMRRFVEDPLNVDAHLSDMAYDELNGLAPEAPEEVLEAVRALTPEVCAAAMARALATAIVRAPEQLEDRPPGFAEYVKAEFDGPPPEDGRTFVELDETECAHRPCRITVGTDALHWQAGDGSASMLVPFEELYRLSRDLHEDEDEDVVMLAEVEDRDGPALFAVTDRRIVLHDVARGAEGDDDYRRETARSALSDVEARVDDDGAGVLSFRIGDDEQLTDLGPMDPQVAEALSAALGAGELAATSP